MTQIRLTVAIALIVQGCSSISKEGVDTWQAQLDARNENIYLMGPISMGRVSDFESRIETSKDYAQMRCLEKAGYLRFISDENIADGNFHGFNNMLNTVQGGITRRINTEMTPLGEDLRGSIVHTPAVQKYLSDHPSLRFLFFRFRKSTVAKLVSNNLIEKDASKFRVIESEVVAQVSDEGKKYIEACPDGSSADRKTVLYTRALVKWDAFSSAWKFIAADAVQSDGDMTSTHNVDDALKAA